MMDTIDTNLLFPSVVNRSYLHDLGEEACIYLELGPNLLVMLWLDIGPAIRSTSQAELKPAGLSVDAAWHVAMSNLGEQLTTGALKVGVASFDDGEKAVFLEGHWLASAAIFHTGLYPWFSDLLGAEGLLALVSERDSLIVFAESASTLVRQRAEQFATEAALQSRKPFGMNLFRLEDDGPAYVGAFAA